MKAYGKDIVRSIRHSGKRFLAIMVICILGCAMFSGLTASCRDLERSADHFFDASKLHDLKVVSTTGLTKDDLKNLKKVNDVSLAVGVYGVEATAKAGQQELSTVLETIPEEDIDKPSILSGRLPHEEGEAAVSSRFLKESGLHVGDYFTVDEKNGTASDENMVSLSGFVSVLSLQRFHITAEILDPTLVNNPNGSVSYRDASASSYTAYVTKESFAHPEMQPFMSVLLRVKGADDLLCYSSSYKEKVKRAEDTITKEIRPKRDDKKGIWYVQNRSAMSGYANIGSDADSIQAIANVFPAVFFVVAILISLTAVTRMVEEERVLIGTYKALGFENGEIFQKYMLYSFSASAAGSLIGSLLAFIALPIFIFRIFKTMYLLPEYRLSFYPDIGLAGASLFIGGIVLAAGIACKNELSRTPAELMRPKAPKPGIRTALERIPFLWRQLTFMGKITVRNIFQYKKRMLMTVFGVAGCMALLLFGFAIRDSVHDLMPRQYGQVIKYDMLATSDTGHYDDLLAAAKSKDVRSYLETEVTTATVKKTANSDQEISLTLIVVPEGKELDDYVSLRRKDGRKIHLKDNDILVTMNAGDVLGFSDGNSVSCQLQDLTEAKFPHVTLIWNYLGNYIYMREKTYEKYFGDYEPNGILVNLSDNAHDQAAFSEKFAGNEGITSCISTQKLADSFSTAFELINAVVYIIILMSAALAFTVLFTLQTTNISERERELATIKVLGFYDPEVHSYVNRETWILTGIGIVLGIPLGYAFAQTLTTVLNLPSIYLAVSLHGISYVLATGLSVLFAFLVSLISNRLLNRIDPVTALKSVE